MDTTPVIVAAALLLVVGAGLVAGMAWRRDRLRLRRELALAREQTAELRERLDSLSQDLLTLRGGPGGSSQGAESYLITDAGIERPVPNVPDRLVLTATLGEPLVKVVALGHGLARALSPESRNRIGFEMRREVRRARKHRRREMKEAWRQRRGEQRAHPETEAA